METTLNARYRFRDLWIGNVVAPAKDPSSSSRSSERTTTKSDSYSDTSSRSPAPSSHVACSTLDGGVLGDDDDPLGAVRDAWREYIAEGPTVRRPTNVPM